MASDPNYSSGATPGEEVQVAVAEVLPIAGDIRVRCLQIGLTEPGIVIEICRGVVSQLPTDCIGLGEIIDI